MSGTGKPVLEVRGLTVDFGGVRAVDDVTFDVADGQILGIIGPNGAGKTTVFDAISGFVNARGRVILDGNDVSEMSPEKRSRSRLGRSFQDAKLFPSLTVFETLAVALERHIRAEGVVSTAINAPWVRRTERRVAKRVEELIELMGLDAFRDKFVSELSTGSRRIVDLAVIMAHEPLVLLLDEPSSGIAQRETEALAPLLLRIRQQTGAALLVIEHDMPLITSISDELLALETGAVLTRGAPDEVLADPRLVAAYLGTDQSVLQRSGARGKPARAGAGAATATATRRRRTRVVGSAETQVMTTRSRPLRAGDTADSAAPTATRPARRRKPSS